MKKKISYFLFGLVMFISVFNMKALAAEILSCVYNVSGLEVYDIEYILLIQNSDSSIGVFVSNNRDNGYVNIRNKINGAKIFIDVESQYFNYLHVFTACPDRAVTFQVDVPEASDEIEFLLWDSTGECLNKEDNKCIYDQLVWRKDYIPDELSELKFTTADGKNQLEIYDEYTNKSYFVQGFRPLEAVKPETPSEPEKPNTPRLDYSSWCSADNKANLGIRKAFKTIGYVVILLKWLVPLLIIIFGMIDFGKAVISSDDKAISKASSSLIKRIIAGVVIFLVPTVIPSIIGLLEITNGIEEKDNTNFGACTRCVFDPINDCEIDDK